MKPKITALLLFAIASSFQTLWATEFEAPPGPTIGERMSAMEYCHRYSRYAVSEMYSYGIPASITLAQGILESDWGASYLAVLGNNHFGIKAYRVNYTTNKIYVDDDREQEPFCAFATVEEGYHYHSIFLLSDSRYERLFKLPSNDYHAWAHGLRECGYATDPNYANKLIHLIEEYSLFMFDMSE